MNTVTIRSFSVMGFQKVQARFAVALIVVYLCFISVFSRGVLMALLAHALAMLPRLNFKLTPLNCVGTISKLLDERRGKLEETPTPQRSSKEKDRRFLQFFRLRNSSTARQPLENTNT